MEMRRILLAEKVEYVYQKWHERGAAEWFAKNPDDMKFFSWALEAYKQWQE